MGFWNKVKEGATNVQNTIQKGATNIQEEIKRRQEISNQKSAILAKLDMGELRKVCRDMGIGEPLPYDIDPINGKKYKRTLTRNHYISRIKDKLTLEQLQDYCDKHRIKIPEPPVDEPIEVKRQPTPTSSQSKTEPQVTTIEIKKQGEFDAILDNINNEFEIVENVRDEEDFKKQLSQFLKYKYSGIRLEQPNPRGRGDILINNKYLLELKIAKNKYILRDLKGQIHDYKKVYDKVAVVLLDVGEVPRTEIKEYMEDYHSFGADVLLLEGVLNKRKQRGRQINIRM